MFDLDIRQYVERLGDWLLHLFQLTQLYLLLGMNLLFSIIVL